MKSKKGGMEFGWIFAVIVGAVILFLAFYFVGTNLLSERIKKDTVAAQTFETLMNPLSYLGSLGAVTSMPLNLSEKSELLLECDTGEDIGSKLGWNSITVMTGKKGSESIPRTAYDKYIYADISGLEVKNLHSITMSFDMPWRVADLTMLWPADRIYCFEDTPRDLKDKLEDLNISSIVLDEDECPDDVEVTSVCFKSSGCDINAYNGIVTKEDRTKLPYSGNALMLAAIFSEPDLYKCNAVRLAKRLSMQAQIYGAKSEAASCGISTGQLKSAADGIAEYGIGTDITRVNRLSNEAQAAQGILRC